MNKLSQEYADAITVLSQQRKSYPAIAREMSRLFPGKVFDGDSIRKWMMNNGLGYVKLERFHQEQGWPQTQKQLDMVAAKYKGSERIFVCSDLHFPYTDWDWAEYAFNVAVGCDVAILGGDILNEDAFGKFKDQPPDFKSEYKIAVTTLLQLTHMVRTVMIAGNHDRRFAKHLKHSVDTDINQYDFLFKGDRPDPLAALAEDVSADYVPNWWVNIDGVIVSHPDKYSGVPYRNITNSIDYFMPRIDDWHTLCQGHSHQAGEGTYKGKHWYETGCMCVQTDYNRNASQTNPMWTQGFAVLRLKDGKLVPNKSRLYTGKVYK